MRKFTTITGELYAFIFDRPYRSRILSPILCTLDNINHKFLNQARAGRSAWFLKIDPVRIVSMRVRVCMCVCVCVSAPEAINN